MGSLIKNELIKIFRKKSTYIVLIVLALFVVLTNFIYKYMLSTMNMNNYNTSEEYINYAKEELNNINPQSDRENYIQLKTDVDFYELRKQFEENSWQMYILDRDFQGYLYDINVYKYGTNADKERITENPEDVYNRELNKLRNSDWKQYVKEEIAQIEEELSAAKAQKQMIGNESNVKEVDDTITLLETKLELTKMRIEKDIPYGHNFMNEAIEGRIRAAGIDYSYNDKSLSHKEKLARQQTIENCEIDKYIIENKQDVKNYSSVRGVLLNMFDEYSIFLIIFVVMIAGGIVSSEIEKGTIKMLLVKPYKRWKILLAKYIVSLMMILFIFGVTVLMQILIGGIIFGFDSLSIPAVVYNFDTNSLETYNLFKYLGLLALSKLPIYILLGTLAFAVSCIFGNTVLAIVLPIIGNTGGAIISIILTTHPIKQLAIFPTLNWDFSQFLFGRLPQFEFTSLGFATGVCICYWIIMVVAGWFAFNKKEIKNI